MKSRGDIEARIQSLLVAELDQRVAKANEKLPHHCAHHIRQPLDSRKTIDGEPNPAFNRVSDDKGLPVAQTIGLCGLGKGDPETWNGTICEDPIDAQNCPHQAFEPIATKEQIWDGLIDQFNDPEWAVENLPEAAALAWVAEEAELVEQTARVVALVEQVEVMGETSEVGIYVGPELPWWKRWIFRLLGIKTRQPFLLPEGDDDDTGLSP